MVRRLVLLLACLVAGSAPAGAQDNAVDLLVRRMEQTLTAGDRAGFQALFSSVPQALVVHSWNATVPVSAEATSANDADSWGAAFTRAATVPRTGVFGATLSMTKLFVADHPDYPPPGPFGRWLTEVFNEWPEGSRPPVGR